MKLPPVAKFLSEHPSPQKEDFEGLFSFEALPYMVVCLYAYPELIPSFANHLDFDENLPGTAESTLAAIEWFTSLSNKLRETLALGDDPTAYLDFYLTKKHGESHWLNGKSIEPNLPHHAERFFLTDKIAYDEYNGKFYQYQASTGLWESISKERLLGVAARYWLKFADGISDARMRGKLMAKRTTGFLNSFIQFGASECHFHSTQKASILHANNCMVMLVGAKDRTRIDPSPMFFSRSRLKVDHIKDRNKPVKFLEYLNNVVSPDDVEILQLWAGTVLMGVNYHSKILLLTGVGGSGKSSFISIIQGIIGEHASIELRTKGLDGRYALGRFIGKNLLLGLDVPLNFLQMEGVSHLKKLTGNDLLSPEVKNSSKEYRIKGNFNIAITSNTRLKLRLQGDSEAWERRLVHIEFKPKSVVFPKVDFVEDLLKKEGPDILTWMIKGANLVRHLKDTTKKNWPLSPAQKRRIDDMLLEADSVRAFLLERVEKREKRNLTTRDLFTEYDNYCDARGWISLPRGVVTRSLPALMVELYGSKLRTDIRRKKEDGGEEILRGYGNVGWK